MSLLSNAMLSTLMLSLLFIQSSNLKVFLDGILVEYFWWLFLVAFLGGFSWLQRLRLQFDITNFVSRSELELCDEQRLLGIPTIRTPEHPPPDFPA